MSNPPIVVNLDDDEVQIVAPPPAKVRPPHPQVLPQQQIHNQYLLNRVTPYQAPLVNIGTYSHNNNMVYGNNIGAYNQFGAVPINGSYSNNIAINALIQNNLPRYSFATISFSLINSKEFTARAEGLIGKDVLAILRAIPGARFEYAGHRWVFPLDAHEILQNRNTVEPLPRSIITAAQMKNQREQSSSADALNDLIGTVPDKVLHSLAPFQREAVHFIIKNNGRALLADEMGLGKTRTAIAAATAFREDWPVLIVCPSSARHHWQAELISILHPDIIESREITIIESASQPISTGQRNFRYKFVIMSYNLIVKLAEPLAAFNFNVVIADECHYLKSRTAQRTLCLVPLLQKVRRALLLSGTPALSRPIELFPQLHALAPQQWPNVKEYGKRYCRHIKRIGTGINKSNKSWQEFGGASNTSELHLMLTTSLMIRRLKADILSQMPKKRRVIERIGVKDANKRAELARLLEEIRVQEKIISSKKKKTNSGKRSRANETEAIGGTGEELDDANRYVDIEDIPDAAVGGGEGGSTLHTSLSSEELSEVKKRHKVALMELFNQSGLAKLPDVLKHLGAFLDNKMSGKVLIFAHHRNVLDGVSAFLKKRGDLFIRIDGQTSGKERHSRVEYFQNSVCRVAVLAITAAGIAITLTAASTVMFAEIFWTPGSLIQAEDRAHRIGQTSEVLVKYFLADDTVDELLWPLVRKKMRLLGEFVEGMVGQDMSASHVGATSGDENGNSSSSGGGSSSGEGGKDGVKGPSAAGGGKRDWLTEKLLDEVPSSSSSSSSAKKRSFGDIKDSSSSNNNNIDSESQLDELEDLVKEIEKDDTERVVNPEEEGDSDDDSGDNNAKNSSSSSSSSSAGGGAGLGLVKNDSSGTVDQTNEEDLDVSAELTDYLAELYMSEQLAVNGVPWSTLAQQQIVHRFDGSGRVTVMTASELAEMQSKNSKRSGGAPEVFDLDIDDIGKSEAELIYGHNCTTSSSGGSSSNVNGRKGRTGYAYSGQCDEVIDLFNDEVTSITSGDGGGVIDLAGTPQIEEISDNTTDSSAGAAAAAAPVSTVAAPPPPPPVVRNDYSNMLTGGVGTVQKSSIYSSSGPSGRFIPAVIHSSHGSNNSLGGLGGAASTTSASPSLGLNGGVASASGGGVRSSTPRQFVPKVKVSPRKTPGTTTVDLAEAAERESIAAAAAVTDTVYESTIV